MIAGFAEHFATGDFGNTRNRVETARKYRPGTPEVVLPCRWHMAWCAHHDCAARAASCCRSLATSMCRTHRRAREYVSDVGQWIAARSTAVVPASPGGGDAHARNTEPLSLDQLAFELGIHQRTLRAAARTGRLAVQFALRSVFGCPVRHATRAAGVRFMETHYRLFAGQQFCPAPLPSVPADFNERLRRLRRRLGFSQHVLARRIGAAGKAVVYQWESRKRVPSPVFWQKVEQLEQTSFTGRRRAKRISST